MNWFSPRRILVGVSVVARLAAPLGLFVLATACLADHDHGTAAASCPGSCPSSDLEVTLTEPGTVEVDEPCRAVCYHHDDTGRHCRTYRIIQSTPGACYATARFDSTNSLSVAYVEFRAGTECCGGVVASPATWAPSSKH